MGGRGRGRGRGAVPPSVASAPFNFGSSNGPASTSGIYTSRTEPSQKFPEILIPEAPKIENFTVFEIKSAEYSDRIDSLLKISPSFRPIKTTQAKIDRYSDKYLKHVINANDRRERLNSIQSNLEFFPEELHSVYVQDSSVKSTKKKSATNSVSFKDTLNHLETLAQKEESSNGEDGKEDEEDDDEEGQEEVEDEEFEDETDYNYSYFDNGEDNGDYDDGNDEAVF